MGDGWFPPPKFGVLFLEEGGGYCAGKRMSGPLGLPFGKVQWPHHTPSELGARNFRMRILEPSQIMKTGEIQDWF